MLQCAYEVLLHFSSYNQTHTHTHTHTQYIRHCTGREFQGSTRCDNLIPGMILCQQNTHICALAAAVALQMLPLRSCALCEATMTLSENPDNHFPEHIAATLSRRPGRQDVQKTVVTTGSPLIAERAKSRRGLNQANKMDGPCLCRISLAASRETLRHHEQGTLSRSTCLARVRASVSEQSPTFTSSATVSHRVRTLSALASGLCILDCPVLGPFYTLSRPFLEPPPPFKTLDLFGTYSPQANVASTFISVPTTRDVIRCSTFLSLLFLPTVYNGHAFLPLLLGIGRLICSVAQANSSSNMSKCGLVHEFV
jgi:hypothetical protein